MRQGAILFGVGSLIFAAMVFFLLSGENQSHVPVNPIETSTIKETRKLVRDVTPDGILQSPALDKVILERLPAKEVPPSPVKPPKPSPYKRPVVLEAGRLLSADTEIQLSGISAVPVDQVCSDASGAPWPCGKFAKTAFNAFVRGRTIECDPVEKKALTIATRCFIGKQDMSFWLVNSGWAYSDIDAYSDAEIFAKQEFRGIWRKIRP